MGWTNPAQENCYLPSYVANNCLTQAKYLRPVVVYILSNSIYLKYLQNTFLLSKKRSPQEISNIFSFSENISKNMWFLRNLYPKGYATSHLCSCCEMQHHF